MGVDDVFETWQVKRPRLLWAIGLTLAGIIFLCSLFFYLRWQSDREKIAQSLERLVEKQGRSQIELGLPIKQELVQNDTPMVLKQEWEGDSDHIPASFDSIEQHYLKKWDKNDKDAPAIVTFFLTNRESYLNGVRHVDFWAQDYRLKSLRYVPDVLSDQSLFTFSVDAAGKPVTLESLITSQPAMANHVLQKLSAKGVADSPDWAGLINNDLARQDFETSPTALILWPKDEIHRLELPFAELYDFFNNDYLTGEARMAYETYLAEKAEAERLAREAAERAAAELRQQRVITKGPEGAGKVVALTFDDGPRRETTPRILDTLNQHGIKATFFALGTAIPGNEDLLKSMSDQGHQIANHTWSHPNLAHLSLAQIQHELDQTQQKITEVTGIPPTVIRPPYGSYNDKVLQATPLTLVNWSIDTWDWKNRNTASILASVKSQLSEGGIILMHDIHPTTADALPAVIDYLKSEGYSFVTINQLMGLN